MEKAYASKSNPMTYNFLDPCLFNFEVLDLANGKFALKLRDIWIPKSLETNQHCVRFYLPRMENMFRIRDRMVKVEHSGTISRMLSWSLNEGNVWVRDNLKNIDFALNFYKENTNSNLYIY
jgi:hypothetical protein